MKRNIFLTESQILKIKEDIRALNYKDDITKTKGSWKEIPIEFKNFVVLALFLPFLLVTS